MTRARGRFSSMPDWRVEVLLRANLELAEAFAEVRPTDGLMEHARKTLAWAERGARK